MTSNMGTGMELQSPMVTRKYGTFDWENLSVTTMSKTIW
jgi:hypothetical protein